MALEGIKSVIGFLEKYDKNLKLTYDEKRDLFVIENSSNMTPQDISRQFSGYTFWSYQPTVMNEKDADENIMLKLLPITDRSIVFGPEFLDSVFS